MWLLSHWLVAGVPLPCEALESVYAWKGRLLSPPLSSFLVQPMNRKREGERAQSDLARRGGGGGRSLCRARAAPSEQGLLRKGASLPPAAALGEGEKKRKRRRRGGGPFILLPSFARAAAGAEWKGPSDWKSKGNHRRGGRGGEGRLSRAPLTSPPPVIYGGQRGWPSRASRCLQEVNLFPGAQAAFKLLYSM